MSRGITYAGAAMAALLCLFVPRSPAPAQGVDPVGRWKKARPDASWSFPRDHWSHDGFKTEWWYLTGHLSSAGETPRHFAYQFTFFRIGLLPACRNGTRDGPAATWSWGMPP